MHIRRMAALDCDELVLELAGDDARTAVADGEVEVTRTHPADRRDYRRRAASKRLAQPAALGIGLPLIDRIGLLTHAKAGFARKRQQRIASDAGQDRARERRRGDRAVV